MDTVYLQEFVYLASTLSFKRTAERFYVSRSVISRHLAALEESIGVKLVDRSNQAVTLTKAGESFYRDARVILRDIDLALDHVRIVQNSQKRIVRIGYLRNAARPVIVDFVKDLKEMAPDLHPVLSCMEYGELRRAMDKGSIDVAIAVNVDSSVSRNYRSTPLYTDTLYAVMSKEHPLAARGGALNIDDLPEEKLLLPDSLVYSGISEVIDGIMESKMQMVAREFYGDIDMLYLKVQTEDYIALSSGLNNIMFAGSLAVRPVLGIDADFTVSAFYQDDLGCETYEACRAAFEAASASLKGCSAAGDKPVGFKLVGAESESTPLRGSEQ